MTDSVWLVTSGDYSDYHVIVGFTTEAAAEAFVNRENERPAATYNKLVVEQFPLMTAVPAQIDLVYIATAIVLNGAVREAKEWTAPRLTSYDLIPGVDTKCIFAMVGDGGPPQRAPQIMVTGTDRDEVIRTRDEWVAQQIANP